MKRKKAVVLLSGGLDSSTCLYWAFNKRYKCYALIFDYGQRHIKEIKQAKKLALKLKVDFKLVKLNLPWLKTSSLVDKSKKLPDIKLAKITNAEIPSTYVPARNLMMLSVASSWADAMRADVVIMGANVLDYSGYPDCRPSFINAFQKTVNEGTKSKKLKILTPLLKLTKSQIIKLAVKLNVPLDLTWSCYKGGRFPCGKCDSCKLRKKAFDELEIKDPIVSSCSPLSKGGFEEKIKNRRI
ncbi:MAG TPA: 7-cyano-7-deazaguanine synthase QueC [Elusimicrobiales bacterium]|nr:7-cyano-7-deazaguanine synthase QueC [Elusimicrobiales bacterium]